MEKGFGLLIFGVGGALESIGCGKCTRTSNGHWGKFIKIIWGRGEFFYCQPTKNLVVSLWYYQENSKFEVV